MNRTTTAAVTNAQAIYPNLKAAAFFHSTPVLDRKRRTQWDSKFNNYARRSRNMHGKQTLLRNVSAYAEYIFQSWQSDFDQDDPFSSRGPSWFKKQYGAKGLRKDWTDSEGPQYRRKRGTQFGEDDFEVETIFRSAFGGGKGSFYWSFINEENPQWRSSSGHSNRYNRSSWRSRFEDEYDSADSDNNDEPDLTSDRLALGLSASGPLKIEQVKTAYRECALKWHPDRHQGSTKGVAEEKFKLCSAAYQTLCDRLVMS